MEIKKASGRELRRIKRMYLEAFPRAERKPFWIMKQKAGQGVMELLAIREKVSFGFLMLIHWSS